MSDFPCPCLSSLSYQDCCQPFHLNEKKPSTAEQLMRSRYVAYTQSNIDYIVATTVPNQQSLLDTKAIREWSQTTQWVGLEILAFNPSYSKNHSTVEFNALFQTENGVQVHHELSLFVNIDNRWYFVDPTVPLPSQKSLCFCGSGQKFKHCCNRK